MHCLVSQIEINCATYDNCTHLENWSHWKPAGGGDHGVGVFVFCSVVLVVCKHIKMYCRSLKLGTHKPSPSYVTTLYGA